VALLVVFFVAGGILIYANNHHGGANRTFDVTVSGATSMTPSTLQAYQNDMVTIRVHSDTTGEVHLHEYDIPFDAVAGQVVTHTFKADKTCSCDIEWESTSHQLGTLIVSP
jgi:hypothetical protein